MHPRCYRSQFLELTSWLKRYNDHPQAKRIYRLAISRMPKGYKRPSSPSKVIGVEGTIIQKKPPTNTKVKENYQKINCLKKED